MPESVALIRILEHESAILDRAVAALLEECGPLPRPGDLVLVKPNLVAMANARHACTHPRVVRAVCAYLLDLRAKVLVGDSPAFGSAGQVARASGLSAALKPLGLRVQGLGRPVAIRLSQGGSIGVSRDALDADLILNVPKLKAHSQLRISGAVKNLFGCVVGFRKALSHLRLGPTDGLFESMLVDVMLALPKVVSLMDAVHPMHVSGPILGRPYRLGLLAASASPVALDTAVYGILGLVPADVPLWLECLGRRLPGARAEDLRYPLEPPTGFDASDFEAPEKLAPMEFRPLRFVRGRLKSLRDLFHRH